MPGPASRCQTWSAAQVAAGSSSGSTRAMSGARQRRRNGEPPDDDARPDYHQRRPWTAPTRSTDHRTSPPRSPARSWLCPICWRAMTSPRSRGSRPAACPAPASRRRCCRCWWRRCGERASSWRRAAWWWWSTTTRPPDALAESAAPYLPGAAVAYLPSRGAAYGSGLEPAAHLVGERALALDVLAQGGLVAVSADALVERIAPVDRRPAVVELDRRRRAGLRRGRRAAGRGRLRARRARSRSAAASPCGAGSSTCSRRRAASRSGSSSSATRSSACRPSRRSPSAPCTSSTAPSCIPRPEPGDLEQEWGAEADEPVIPAGLVALAPELERLAQVLVWNPEQVVEAAREHSEEAGRSPARPAAAVARLRAAAGGRGAGRAQRRARGAAAGAARSRSRRSRPALASFGIAEAENELRALVRAGYRVMSASRTVARPSAPGWP